jgi:hypothetical protein
MKKVIKVLIMTLLIGLTAAQMYGLTLFSDDFDSETTKLAAWKESSTTYVTRYTGTYKVGVASMQIRGGYNAVTYVNTAPYTSIVLSFRLAGYSLESGNSVQAFYNVGSGDVVCATLPYTSANGKFISYSISIPKGYKGFKFGFKVVGDTSDYGYVEDVVLTGLR